MLSQRSVYTTIPASDVSRAQRWYEEKLGFKPRAIEPSGSMYDAGGGSSFLIYPTPNAGQAPNTLMSFASTDVQADVTALRARGVVFEEYDFPGLKTVQGVAKVGNIEAAWFKDSEGNILGISTSA